MAEKQKEYRPYVGIEAPEKEQWEGVFRALYQHGSDVLDTHKTPSQPMFDPAFQEGLRAEKEDPQKWEDALELQGKKGVIVVEINGGERWISTEDIENHPSGKMWYGKHTNTIRLSQKTEEEGSPKTYIHLDFHGDLSNCYNVEQLEGLVRAVADGRQLRLDKPETREKVLAQVRQLDELLLAWLQEKRSATLREIEKAERAELEAIDLL